jgi:hypothetical protein
MQRGWVLSPRNKSFWTLFHRHLLLRHEVGDGETMEKGTVCEDNERLEREPGGTISASRAKASVLQGIACKNEARLTGG